MFIYDLPGNNQKNCKILYNLLKYTNTTNYIFICKVQLSGFIL